MEFEMVRIEFMIQEKNSCPRADAPHKESWGIRFGFNRETENRG